MAVMLANIGPCPCSPGGENHDKARRLAKMPTPQPAAKPEGEEIERAIRNAEFFEGYRKRDTAAGQPCRCAMKDEELHEMTSALLVLKAENAEIAHELAIADKSAADAIEVIHRLQAENARLTATCEDQRRVISEMTADESRDIDTIARLTEEIEFIKTARKNDLTSAAAEVERLKARVADLDYWGPVEQAVAEAGLYPQFPRASLVERVVGGLALIAKLKAELDEAQEKVKSWEQDFNMYRRAWIRELGGLVIPKHHDIDALVLTTRDQREKSLRCEAAESRLSALTTENAGLREALTAYHEEWKAELLGGAALALSASRKGGDRG
jgi:hypothetical protein